MGTGLLRLVIVRQSKPIPIPACPATRSARGVHRRASHGSQALLFTPLRGKEKSKAALPS